MLTSDTFKSHCTIHLVETQHHIRCSGYVSHLQYHIASSYLKLSTKYGAVDRTHLQYHMASSYLKLSTTYGAVDRFLIYNITLLHLT